MGNTAAAGELPLCPEDALIPAHVREGSQPKEEAGQLHAACGPAGGRTPRRVPTPKHGCSALLLCMQRAAQIAHVFPFTTHTTHLDTIVFLYKNSARNSYR